jgi:hypothetical protein
MKTCPWQATLHCCEINNKEGYREWGWTLLISTGTHNHKPSGALGLPQYRCVDWDANADAVIEDGVRYSTVPSIVYTKLVEQRYHVL